MEERRSVGEGASEREGSRVMGGECSGVEGSLGGVVASEVGWLVGWRGAAGCAEGAEGGG